MKYLVGLDTDGHFVLSCLYDRNGCIQLLKKLSDGDMLGLKTNASDDELILMLAIEFEQYVIDNFVCRGLLEIVKI